MSTSTFVSVPGPKSGGRSWRKSLFPRRLGHTTCSSQHEHLQWGPFRNAAATSALASLGLYVDLGDF
jgi:hypothetical protein